MITQLKASDTFIKVITRVKKVRAIILCEGARDTEVLKAVARRLNLVKELENVAVTDAEGIDTLTKEMLPTIIKLMVVKVISRPKPIAMVVDADDVKPEVKVRSIVDGLKSKLQSNGAEVHGKICDNVWRIVVKRGSEEIPILVAVNGVFEEPFTAFILHELEDHIVYLKLLENRLVRDSFPRGGRARELVIEEDFELLDNAERVHVEKAFKHLVCLLQILTALIQA